MRTLDVKRERRKLVEMCILAGSLFVLSLGWSHAEIAGPANFAGGFVAGMAVMGSVIGYSFARRHVMWPD